MSTSRVGARRPTPESCAPVTVAPRNRRSGNDPVRDAERRWVVVATVLGSGIAFLDGTVVNVRFRRSTRPPRRHPRAAMDPRRIPRDAECAAAAGGSLGDLYGRKRGFLTGLVAFSSPARPVASHQTPPCSSSRGGTGRGRRVARTRQSRPHLGDVSSRRPRRAVGAWSGLAGVSGAIGPFIGDGSSTPCRGDSSSSSTFHSRRRASSSRCGTCREPRRGRSRVPPTSRSRGRVDRARGDGYGLIERQWVAGIAGAAILVGFVFIERRVAHPMLPSRSSARRSSRARTSRRWRCTPGSRHDVRIGAPAAEVAQILGARIRAGAAPAHDHDAAALVAVGRAGPAHRSARRR